MCKGVFSIPVGFANINPHGITLPVLLRANYF